MKVGHDDRQGGADDGLVEGEQEQGEQNRPEDLELGSRVELERGQLGRLPLGHRVVLAWRWSNDDGRQGRSVRSEGLGGPRDYPPRGERFASSRR